jgi:(4S)-4-hydroxy-5-phosphonooxypentane-2,3-dione isomerase
MLRQIDLFCVPRLADTGCLEADHNGGTARVLLSVFVAATVKADRQRGGSVSHVAIVARVTVKEGRADEYVAAFEPLLEQAKQEPGTLLYALHRSKDDPHVFWTTEVYADDAAFAAHSASEVHAAASPVFTELIAAADVLIGETLIATGLGG